jgi:hypothetical protein
MVQWEYALLAHHLQDQEWAFTYEGTRQRVSGEDVLEVLNRLGSEGWELAGIRGHVNTPGSDFYLKRSVNVVC